MNELINYIKENLEKEYELIQMNKDRKSYGNKCFHQGVVSALEEVLDFIEEVKVIGNIYENPELLGKE